MDLDQTLRNLIVEILKNNLEIAIFGDRHHLVVEVFFDGELVTEDKHRY
jgi:hypothetical protein